MLFICSKCWCCYNTTYNIRVGTPKRPSLRLGTQIRDTKMADLTLLETCELVKKYSGRAVVNEISITIAQRSIVGLLGRNGAGKTTTFRMIMGMITPNITGTEHLSTPQRQGQSPCNSGNDVYH